MVGNETLSDGFAPGPRSVDVAREYLTWQRHTRRRVETVSLSSVGQAPIHQVVGAAPTGGKRWHS